MLWLVRWGMNAKVCREYHTEHHAEQFARALRLNGTPVEVAAVTLPQGWDARSVHAERAKWDIPVHMVPVCSAPGVVGWGSAFFKG